VPPPGAAAGHARHARPAREPRAGAWIVQLTALQDRARATIAQRLSAKGTRRSSGSGARLARIYRVQVGATTRQAREQAARRLEKEEQFKPYVRAR
jgi:cell division septation protein DedD